MKKLLTIFACFSLVLAGGSLLLFGCGEQTDLKDASANCAQVSNQQAVTVSWEADSVVDKVEISVKHDGNLVSSQTITDPTILAKGETEIYAYYGKQDVSVTLFSLNARKTFNKSVDVFADEYNIAPLSGSMPVLLFSLSLFGDNSIINPTGEKAIPTFVWLVRSGSYNWAKLPENLYKIPTANPDEIYVGEHYDTMVSKTDKWIEELMSINPESKINLFINDFNTYLYPKLITANNVQNYHVTMITDGSATYSEYMDKFNNDNPQQTYEQSRTRLETTLQQVKDAKDYEWSNKFEVNTSEIRQLCYVLAKEDENIDWWLRTYTLGQLNNLTKATEQFKTFNTAVKSELDGKSYDKDTNALLEKNFKVLSTDMDEDVKEKKNANSAALKDLYNLGENMFQAAKEQNKKIMLICGSKVTSEVEFENYAKLAKKFYGDEYMFFYKGHPATPTPFYASKQAQLERLGFVDVDSSIAAELILFYYPEVYMTGYESTTWQSVPEISEQAEPKGYSLFNYTKSNANTNLTYHGAIAYYFSKLTDENSDTYGQYMTANKTNYLIEYADTTKYDFSIYCLEDDTIKNYKNGSVVA